MSNIKKLLYVKNYEEDCILGGADLRRLLEEGEIDHGDKVDVYVYSHSGFVKQTKTVKLVDKEPEYI